MKNQWRKLQMFLFLGFVGAAIICSHGHVHLVHSQASTGQFSIAFSSMYYNDEDVIGNRKIYTVNLDGSNLVRLTRTEARVTEADPAWSPDGKRIVFLSNPPDFEVYDQTYGEFPAWPRYSEVFVVNADGAEQIQLTFNGRGDSNPQWSPDGNRIAFMRADGLYVVDADGSNESLVATVKSGSELQWSPDGQQIVFNFRVDGRSEIGIVTLSAGNVVNLTHQPASDFDPMWSPDGNYIVFVSNREGNMNLYRMDADGSNLLQLTYDETDDLSPVWSPDGEWIAFRRSASFWYTEHTDPAASIHYPMDGSTLHLMKYDGTEEFMLTEPGPYHTLQWLPDGSALLFLATVGAVLENTSALHQLDLTCFYQSNDCSPDNITYIPNTETYGLEDVAISPVPVLEG